jgi:hypothetical protein
MKRKKKKGKKNDVFEYASPENNPEFNVELIPTIEVFPNEEFDFIPDNDIESVQQEKVNPNDEDVWKGQ